MPGNISCPPGNQSHLHFEASARVKTGVSADAVQQPCAAEWAAKNHE